MRATVWATLTAGLLLASPGFAQCIRLLDKAVVVGPEVRLGEVATIERTDPATAEALAQTVLVSKVGKQASVKVEEVLFAVIAKNGPQWAAKLQVRGATECKVTVEGTGQTQNAKPQTQSVAAEDVQANRPVVAELPVVTASVVTPEPARQPAKAAAKSASSTLSSQLTRQVLEELQAPAEDVRVSFETISPLLDQPLGANQRWIIRPLNRTFVGLVQWEAQLVENTRSVSRLTVQAKVERRMSCVVTVGGLGRGEVVSAKDVRLEDRWLDRAMPTLLIKPEEVVGLAAQRGIAAGTALDSRDFKAVDLVKRDDTVDCCLVSGGLKINFKGKALNGARLGDHVLVINQANGEKLAGTLVGQHLVAIGGVTAANNQGERR